MYSLKRLKKLLLNIPVKFEKYALKIIKNCNKYLETNLIIYRESSKKKNCHLFCTYNLILYNIWL